MNSEKVRQTSKHRRQEIGSYLLTTLLLLLLAGMVVVNFQSYSRRTTDLKEAVPQTGIARVVIIFGPQAEEGTPSLSPPKVTVEFHGLRYQCENIGGLPLLQVGKPARIVYRVGRSGQVSVDRVEPLKEPYVKQGSGNYSATGQGDNPYLR